jgi:DNA-binding transcriptional LysR family regulator
MAANSASLDGLIVFVEVVEGGGFTAAARNLDHSVSFVSKEIARLEDRLGVRLLNRTTRSVIPTDIGRVYYERCRQIIADARDAERGITESHAKPQGLLNISAPVSFGLAYLNDVLPEFLADYPEITLNVEMSDRLVDVIAEGFDVVIRAGYLKDSNLIARRLMRSRLLTVASPEYLAREGTPLTPAELPEHACIAFTYKQVTTHWEYLDPDGGSIGVTVDPRAVCNNAETEIALVAAGAGITRMPSFICHREVEDGRLIPILERYETPPIGVYAVYPHRAHLSAKVRVFVDFLIRNFAEA